MASRAARFRGITAIEILAVIAVTGIVAAIAYSALQTYRIRGQVMEGLAATAALEHSVEAAFRRSGEVPSTLPDAGWPQAGPAPERFVASIGVAGGRIDVLYGNQAHEAIAGRRLSLTPYESATLEIVWLCGNKIPGPGLRPLGFAGGGGQSVQLATTIEARFLPSPCR